MGSKPRLLDLFCGAGGAAMGYHRAGFEVVGVDIIPQPHYPFAFEQMDALTYLAWVADRVYHGFRDFDAIHASPPCQAYSALNGLTTNEYPRLIEPVRTLLVRSGLPYVIENVVGAPLVNPIRLCGSSFGLGVRRHRLFEMSDPPALVPTCAHYLQPEPLDVTGTGGPSTKPRTAPGGGLSRKPSSMAQASAAMGINWMTRPEISEAIPPAYTEWIGRQLLAAIENAA
jgi:DNA (cytosine-5)-methyltransferase 1